MGKKVYAYGVQIIFILLMGLFLGIVAGQVYTVHAQSTQQEQVIEEEDTALTDGAEANSGGMFLLMGGFVIIILAVVIAVVATFVSTAAISDEI